MKRDSAGARMTPGQSMEEAVGQEDHSKQNSRQQAESWRRRGVDLVRGFPFVSEVFFLRESYE